MLRIANLAYFDIDIRLRWNVLLIELIDLKFARVFIPNNATQSSDLVAPLEWLLIGAERLDGD